MKVRELIKELSKHDPESDILDVAHMQIVSLMNELEMRQWNKDASAAIEIYEGHPEVGQWGAGPDFPKGHG